MKKSYLKSRIITSVIALLLAALPFLSSAQVVVHLTILPPYSTKLSDYFSRPQQLLIMVQNTTATNQNVQLRGEFTGDNGISIRADQNYKSGSPIRLGPNETRTLSINDIAALFNINEVVFTGISKDQFIRQNGVPDGNYQICVQAFDYYTNKPLSGNAPAGCSNVFPVSNVEDPTVIAPFDEQVVSALAGQNFVISWSTPAGAPPSTQYTVKMVQIFDGKSASDAFNTAGIPIFFQQTVIGTNSLVYGPAMPALTLGRHYAMAITASDPMNTVTFKNHGQSVITSFIYGDTAAVVKPIATTIAQRITLPGVPILIGTIIPTSTIVGNIKWYFAQSEENAPSGQVPAVSSMPARIPGSIAHPVANTPLFVSVMPIYKQGGVSKISQINKNLWNKNQSNTVNEDRENDVDQSIDDDIYQGSSFTSNTDADGNFSISLAGILETISQNPSTSMKLLGYTGADSLRIMISSSQVINGSLSGTFGGFSFTYPISAINSGIDVGNLKAIANTYRFKPRVVDGSGKELTDATVNVYRRADFYNVTNQQLQYEGNYNANQLPREQVVINGVNYVKVAALKSGYTATRLFFQQPGESYELQIDEGDFTTMYNTLSANSIDLSSFTLQQTYSMANAPTILAGTVYKKLNGISIPAQGAVVSMLTNGYLYTSSTDSSGNFGLQTGYGYLYNNAGRIAPLQITSAAQTVLASYNGQSSQSSVVIDQPGKTYNIPITFDVTTFPIAGRVVDDSGNTIPNPVIKWQSTGQYVPADDQGNFNTTNVAGTDSLIISKLGYAEKHYGVVITTNGMVQLNVKIPPNMPRSPIPLMVNPRSNPNNGVVYAVNGNVGSIMLDKVQGEIDLHINDQQGNPIPGALVNIDATPLPQDAVADNTGLVRIIGPAGMLTFDIKGPAGSNYVPVQTGYYIPDNNTITSRISLTNGVKLTGKVTANGAPVAGAVVGIQGQDYGTTTTATDGTYSLIEPNGSYQLEATKQGYQAGLINGNYTTNQTVNFTLSVSSVNITRLLGFNVQVDQVKNNGNSKLITGEFINLPSNSVFSAASGATIKFQDVAVTIQPDGTAIPVGGTVYTTQSSINLKAFGYLPIVATNGDQDQYNDVINVVSRGTDGKHGQIMCSAMLDFASFTPPGIPSYFPDGQIRIANNPADPQEVVLLTDDGSAPGNGLLTFSPNGSNQLNIYGFKLNADFQSSYIQSDGIHLNGSIDFSSLPVLSSSKFNVQALIGKDGMVSKVTAQPNLSFSLAGWGGTVSSFSFNENGFTLGGSINVQMPASGASTVSFSNLQIAKDQVYGGSFTLPNSGVNVFNIANINASGISFGKLGNSGTYYLSASKSSIAFTGAAGNYIDPITLSQFQIQTDGKFAVTAQTDLHNSFFGGVATVNVSQLGISNLNGEPAIDINGDFGLSIPGATASVGGIHFKSGGRISVDNLGIGFDVAGIAKANVNIGFKSDNSGTGFSGSGDFNVGGFADIGVGFSYYKVPKGFDLSTSFTASTDIPLGTSGLSITQLGGGFSKKASNNSWDIDINGTISVGYQAFANAHVDFNIQNGPVITGTASLNIANMNGLANGKLIIDVPDKFVSVDFGAGVNMLGISGNTGGRMVLSLDKSDPYYMMGMYANESAFGLISLSGGVIGAYNLDMNKHRKELLNYFSADHMPSVGADGKFSGISMYTQFEEDLRDILPNFNVDLKLIDIGLHSYFNMGFYGFLSANLTDWNPRLSVGFGVNYNMGGDVEFSAVDFIDWHAGLAVGFNADFAGSVTINPNSLSMSAEAGALFHAYFGDISPGYCITGTNIFNIPPYDPDHWWVSLCFNPRLHIDYSTQNGFHFSYR